MTLADGIGTAAAVCTTGAFVPQILKIRKQGGEDLSYPMLAVYLAGILLWLWYGLLFHAPAVIWANVVTAFLVGTSIVMKVSHAQKQDRKRGRRPRIAVDMDEVIADSLSHHLYRYNQETGQKLTPETIRLKGLKSAISGEDLALFYRLPHEAGFFADLAVIEGSQHALKTLSAEYDIFITSAAMEVPPSFDDKFKWLQRHFPFIPTSRIVFCGDKGIIDADYLVDDRSRHFAGFRGTGILFTAPHNAQENSPLRANNWDEVLAILQKEQPEVQLSAPGNFVKAEAEGLA